MFVCRECYVLLGRGLCDEMITRPEESYRLWCVVVCDLKTVVNEEVLVHSGGVAPKEKILGLTVELRNIEEGVVTPTTIYVV
jgi:hypothetical protein